MEPVWAHQAQAPRRFLRSCPICPRQWTQLAAAPPLPHRRLGLRLLLLPVPPPVPLSSPPPCSPAGGFGRGPWHYLLRAHGGTEAGGTGEKGPFRLAMTSSPLLSSHPCSWKCMWRGTGRQVGGWGRENWRRQLGDKDVREAAGGEGNVWGRLGSWRLYISANKRIF